MYTDPKILESIRKVEAARAENVKLNPARMSAEEKEVLLRTFHPDYRENQFTTLRVGPNKGGKVPLPSSYPNGNLPGMVRSPRRYHSRDGTYRKQSSQQLLSLPIPLQGCIGSKQPEFHLSRRSPRTEEYRQ